MSDGVDGKLTDAERAAISAAFVVLEDNGIDARLPWECDLDDEESGNYEAFVAALRAYAAPIETERDELRAAAQNADSQLMAALEAHAWGESLAYILAYIHSARAALSAETKP